MIDYKIFSMRLIGLIAIILAVYGVIVLGIYFLPFMLATIIATTIEPLIRGICHKFPKISKKIIVGFLVFIVYGILSTLLVLVCFRLLKESTALIDIIPKMYQKSVDMFSNHFDNFKKAYTVLPDTISSKVYEIGTNILSGVTSALTGMLNSVFDFIMFLPTVIIYAVVTILATYFVAMDRNIILNTLQETLPKRWFDNFVNIIDKSINSILKYFKAQLILAGITFIGSVALFIVVRQPYPFTISLILAFLDILPVLGIGSAMVPWAIYNGLNGNIGQAVTITVIYAILLVVRQLLEPKVVSSSLGIKPIVTLFSMFIGFKVYGVLGLIAGPILCIILKDVFNVVLETGYIKSMFVERKDRPMKYRIVKEKD